MTKNAHLLTLLFFLLTVVSCDSGSNQENEIALPASEVAKRQVTIMVQEAEKENGIIKQHYLQLDQSIRNQITLKEYDRFLLNEYTKLNDKLKNRLDNSERETFSVAEFENYKEILQNNSELPQWYISMKKNTLEKILKVNKQQSE